MSESATSAGKRVFGSAQELVDFVGGELGVSPWITIEQSRIDAFADATDDHQWIHTDPERAAAGPFGATIAHGLLTLSLVPHLVSQIYSVEGTRMAVNYGSDRVRFVTPVRVGSRIRASSVLQGADQVADAVHLTVATTIEIEGQPRPAAVVVHLGRYYF
jgi:acyl dehydratase